MVIQTVIRKGNCKSFQGQHINKINLGHLNFSATIYPEYTYKTQSKKNVEPDFCQNKIIFRHFMGVKDS